MKYRKLTPSSVLAMILCITLLCTALVGCGAVGKTETGAEAELVVDSDVDNITVLSETTVTESPDYIHTLEEALSSTISVEGFIAEGYEGGVTDYTFKSVEYTDTLPDGMYISDGIIYSSDGEEVGSLTGQLGYEDMVIDGTGEAADGFTFVVIDFDMTNVLEQWHSDDSLQTVCLELYPLFVGMSETTENYFYQYYPIYDNAARVYEYHPTSEIVINYDEVVADAAAKGYEIPEYTVYSYTVFEEGATYNNIRLIYLIGDGVADMSLYLGLQEFSGTLHTLGQSYVRLN